MAAIRIARPFKPALITLATIGDAGSFVTVVWRTFKYLAVLERVVAGPNHLRLAHLRCWWIANTLCVSELFYPAHGRGRSSGADPETLGVSSNSTNDFLS